MEAKKDNPPKKRGAPKGNRNAAKPTSKKIKITLSLNKKMLDQLNKDAERNELSREGYIRKMCKLE